MRKSFLVTGGAGFIGSAVVRHLIANTDHQVAIIDKLTYAGRLENLAQIMDNPRVRFLQADICDGNRVQEFIAAVRPDVILHLAAESHVDRSIGAPAPFIQTNIVGTFTLLQAAYDYWLTLPSAAKDAFRFHHVSTDEVYGSLGSEGLFSETSPYRPNSPYSASKASSDHLVRAWHHTYGLPTIISNCSNNYGPYQYPEKLIPQTILNALEGKPIPVYAAGQNIRDWLYVDDHALALVTVALSGVPGEVYNIGGRSERTNLAVVRMITAMLDAIEPHAKICSRSSLITFVPDRPGHDARYAIDDSKISSELGWAPGTSFESGLAKTIRWYLDNRRWWTAIRASS